ncbi:LysR family transcriptional regulator [Actinomadura sp. CNU-125]|uniref:LysR family transcriptional regulator n=1 Tax=Actinomadura sp. CNU-125 TaxID=1904961 RepID=UPI000958F60C|nr:LysR family transcriptional regulator [Actinomadura sp. CNU-125]OLT22923.1 LysR family transcriptional regulator [Actinomadura sp. CNU-125]
MENPASPRFTLHHLEVLVAVAETGTISAAAERLHMSASAVSSAVTELESRLGTTLTVRRRAKGVRLTATGAAVLVQARLILHHASELQLGTAGGGPVAGPLRLGCYPSLAPTVLPSLVTEFVAANPGVSIDFREGDQDALHRWMAGGDLDLAIAYDLEIPAQWQVTRLGCRTQQLVLPADHRLARTDGPVALADLAEQPMVLLDSPPSVHGIFAVCARAGFTPRIAYRTPSYETARSLVGRGVGWSLLLQRPPEDVTYEGFRLAVRTIIEPVPDPVDVVIVHLAQNPLGRVASAFVEHAVEAAASAPWNCDPVVNMAR